MEKIKSITFKNNKFSFNEGLYIHLECCMCMEENTFGGKTKKELEKTILDNGWKDINSDEFGVTGFWCGCQYNYTKD